MATTTEDRAPTVSQAATANAETARVGAGVAGLVLLTLVFMGGATVMTIEMSASRLLAPYFGTSLFIWAILIGLVMIYLAVGYALGGRIADRYPSAAILYGITGAAGFATGLIPIISGPILRWSLVGFAEYNVSIFFRSLIGVILLFSVPLVLLAFVSPFAIRLRAMSVASAGSTAGAVSALSTVGSILGTLVPVFLLIPRIGTAATLYSAAIVLLAFSILGLVVQSRVGSENSEFRVQNSETPSTTQNPKSKVQNRMALLFAALLAVVLALAFFAPRGFVKPPAMGELIYEKESAYHYIQVVKEGRRTSLMLNEGHAIHSIYNPDTVLTGGPWDYWLVAPYFSKDFRESDMKSMAMIGSAAGTAARAFTEVYGPLPVDGVEIDSEIVDVGNRFFALGDTPNAVTHVEDGRTYLQTGGKDKKWTIVGIDAYRQPYIPFHLTTKEFFQEVRDHLTPDGAVMINAGRTASDTRLVDALAQTMLLVYPNVYVIDVPTMANSMVIGTNSPSQLGNFAENAAHADHPILKQVFDASLQKGNIREVKPQAGAVVFTDDKAPVEEVIDQIILGVVNDVTQ